MLKFNENTANAKKLAIHYANQIGDTFLQDFIAGKATPKTDEQAMQIVQGFWAMTDLAIADNDKGVAVEGVADIEFWMHKLFNKISGYMLKNGYQDIWDKALDER